MTRMSAGDRLSLISILRHAMSRMDVPVDLSPALLGAAKELSALSADLEAARDERNKLHAEYVELESEGLRLQSVWKSDLEAARATALEEAAKVCDEEDTQRSLNAVEAELGSDKWGEPKHAFLAQSHKAITARSLATKIRALKDQKP